MNNMKDLEFIENIYNATLSIPDGKLIIPTALIPTNVFKENLDKYATLNAVTFTYSIGDQGVTNYVYNVKVYKSPRSFLFFDLKPRYITHIVIKSRYSLTAKEYMYDTFSGKSFEQQNDLFEYLMTRYNRIISENNDEILGKFINDLDKVIDKKFTRDDKLEKLLK